MDISILLNKTVTNLWDKTQVQQIKTITGASWALVGQAAFPWGPRQGKEPSLALRCWVGGATSGLPLGTAMGGSGVGPTKALGEQLPGAPTSAALRVDAPKLPPPQSPQETPTQWTGRTSFQTRLRTRQGPVPSPGKGHWVPGTPQRSLREQGPAHCADSQALPQTRSAHHTHQELVPRACALHPQEGGACSWDGAPPQACRVGAGPTTLPVACWTRWEMQ